nr:MAK10-like protein [Tanacetum cinerariifolium]
ARLLLLLDQLEVLGQITALLPLLTERTCVTQREVGYGITDSWDEIVETLQGAPVSTDTELGGYVREFESRVRQDMDEIYTRLDDEQTERQLLAGRLNMLFRDRRAHAHTRLLMEAEARMSRDAWKRAIDGSDHVHGEVISLRTTVLVKAISLPQDVSSTSDRRLDELQNQVQRMIKAHHAPKQPIQVNKITSSCEICSGPHDTQYCMENPEQAFVEYASSRIDEAGDKWYTFKPEQNNLGDTYNPSWKSHTNLRWRQPQNSQNNFSNPPNQFQPNGSIPNFLFNNNPHSFNNLSNLDGLVSNFVASQDARLSKFEAYFK